MTTAYIVDDQPLVRAGIGMLLSGETDIEVIGEAASADEALREVRRLRPDVVLMDIRMPGMDGVTATRELVADAEADRLIRVLVMTTFDDEDVVIEALQAGASGYLLKHASPTEIADAVRRVASGDTWLDATAATRLVDKLRPRGCDPTDITALLTPREQEVLRMVAAGLSNTDIRDCLVLSEATVKTHVARILLKTGSRDRAAAVALAYRSGFVRPEDPVPS
ncbi:response regulator transcription factor [Kocuria coralli]|uniref:Response regulator transcription factor n=1 Tax=Kocuria coralli TaxID=1461025 RepID=A0A5J5KT14_9MICC|nr:response regulator transcription factor [Kocuria coralli]KAA9392907.1 response regulator transcription factor [Kocuria coralli]